ncbi:MAG TPA: DUF6644 family protein [Vicinamibacterales bacterium]|jgi:hypothetical protein
MVVVALQFQPMLEWVQTTRLASTISNSLTLTAILSSIHLVGLTLVVGSVLFASLRLVGFIFYDRSVHEVTDAVGGMIMLGLAISVTSGLLLVAPRAVASVQNGFFQFKMASLVAAVVFHLGVYRRVLRGRELTRSRQRVTGAIGFGLWFAVAVAGCAFILLE